jgi:hypothetical protein
LRFCEERLARYYKCHHESARFFLCGGLIAVDCYVFQVVGEFIKIGIALDATTAGAAVQSIVQLLTDAELPVRIFATTSLAAVMDDDDVKTMLQPHVTALLGALFTIIQQVISEETMATLATIIKCSRLPSRAFLTSALRFLASQFQRQFPAETRPHSVMLIQGLVPLWQRFADAAVADDEDDQALLCMCVPAIPPRTPPPPPSLFGPCRTLTPSACKPA